MKKSFYLTTPIYYPDGLPGMQTAYSAILSDCAARYQRLQGRPVNLTTGTDEHGVNIQKAASSHHKTPQEFTDQMASDFQVIFKKMHISYDTFVRTSDDRHVETVEDVFRKLLKKGHIYKGEYSGWYCISCESFWPLSLGEKKRCPRENCQGTLEKVKEEGYFFKLSSFAGRIIEHLENNPRFIKSRRYREKLSELKAGDIQDLCISRKGLVWGIPVPEDPNFTIYVWFDALMSYLTGAGWNTESFSSSWPPDLQVIREDILTFHGVIWLAFCMALEIPLPSSVYVHGTVSVNGKPHRTAQKGPINLAEVIDLYGIDPFRYYLLSQSRTDSDIEINIPGLIRRLNSNLANDLGNLFHRSVTMIEKYSKLSVPEPQKATSQERNLERVFKQVLNEYKKAMDEMDYREALTSLFDLVDGLNRYINDNQPWHLFRENKNKRLDTILYNLADYLSALSVLTIPFMPTTAAKMWKCLGYEEPIFSQRLDSLKLGGFPPGRKVKPSAPLFPKVEVQDK